MDSTRDTPATPRLPAEHNTFIGRRAELVALRRLLETSRLVTLVGPGGVGKTRLAVHVIRDLHRRFPDGAAFVDLAASRDAALVPSQVAAALDLRDLAGGWMVAEVARSLADRAVLLVLDNCEHLTDACGVLVDTLLHWCPRLKVLATSRRTLDVQGEALLEVPPLAVPQETDGGDPAGFDAVRLLLDRARALDSAWQPSAEEVAALGALCRQLDGIPLAIEMAAARLRTLAPTQLLERLDDRLTLLRGAGPVTAQRHRTLRDTMQWSYELLDEQEQHLWLRASVFAGDFDLAAAEAVCRGEGLDESNVLDALTGLVKASLVTVVRHDAGARFRMLETVRAFGRELLDGSGDAPLVLERHVAWCAALAADASRKYDSPEQPLVFDRLEREHTELSAALAHCLETPSLRPTGLQIATDLWLFWPARGFVTEGRRLLEALLAGSPEDVRERAGALTVAGYLDLAIDPGPAVHLLQEGRDLAEATDQPFFVALATQYLGLAHLFRGELPEADRVLRRAADLHGRLNPHYAAFCLADVGITAVLTGALDDAEASFEECLRHNQGGDPWTRSHALWGMSLVYLLRGAPTESESCGEEALRLMRRVDDRSGVARCIEALSWSAGVQGDLPRAARLAGAAEAVWTSIPAKPPGPVLRFRTQFSEPARRLLGTKRWAVQHAEGAALDRGAAVRLALGESAPVPHRPPGTHGDVLTKRQYEVAALIAEGMTDRQIAEQLVISPRTAESHVEQILARLDFRSRAEIAAWVVRRRET